MEKMKTTKKQIMRNYSKVVCLGYCQLQEVLGFTYPRYYTCGIYGWNADIYEINPDCAICTGYKPFGNIKADYYLIESIKKKAIKIKDNKSFKYDTKCKKLENLLLELFK